jgi:hypothetical protein
LIEEVLLCTLSNIHIAHYLCYYKVSWPTPSIEELTHALDAFCGRKWQGDLEEVQHEAHEHTRAEVLPHRCIEAVYMVTLLRDGFGFHPESRDIVSLACIQSSFNALMTHSTLFCRLLLSM